MKVEHIYVIQCINGVVSIIDTFLSYQRRLAADHAIIYLKKGITYKAIQDGN